MDAEMTTFDDINGTTEPTTCANIQEGENNSQETATAGRSAEGQVTEDAIFEGSTTAPPGETPTQDDLGYRPSRTKK
jgi:hypothetical protein